MTVRKADIILSFEEEEEEDDDEEEEEEEEDAEGPNKAVRISGSVRSICYHILFFNIHFSKCFA